MTLLQRERHRVQRHQARFDPRVVEESFTRLSRLVALLRSIRTSSPLAGAARTRGRQKIGDADDAGERRPQLVAHRREEVALHPGGRLRRLFGLPQVFLGLPAIGQHALESRPALNR